MNNQLRPMALGEILDRTAELYRTHFLLFAGISAIFAGVILLMEILHLGLLALLGYPHIPAHLQWAYAVSLVVQLLAVLLVAGLSVAAFNRVVAWIYLGERATISAAVSSIFLRVRRYLWLMTIISFRAWAPLAVLYVALFAILFSVLPSDFLFNPQAAQHSSANPSTLLAAGVGFLIVLPLLIAAVIYGSLMSLRYSLAMAACVVENLPANDAIRRSIALANGTWGRIFVLGLLVTAIEYILSLIFGFPFIFYAFKHLGKPLPLWILSTQQVAGFLITTLIGPIYSTGLTLFYYDQRIRKEGFDIEWMMQAAGLAPQPELPAPQNS
ncbi:MAG: hypothetical protein ACLPLZ_16280 [Terracidiphilus sp.]|jgi:hypothetical protein